MAGILAGRPHQYSILLNSAAMQTRDEELRTAEADGSVIFLYRPAVIALVAAR